MSKRNQKQNAAEVGVVQFNMSTGLDQAAVGVTSDDAMLAGLLEQLGDDEILEASGDTDEVIEAESTDIVASGSTDATLAAADDLVGDLLDEIASDAEREGAKQQLYAEQQSTAATDAKAPETDAAALTEPAKKGGRRKKADAGDSTESPAEKEPKPARATSVTHSPGALLKAKLGDKAGDFLTFSMSDADLDGPALAAKQAAFIARMDDRDAIADKVREKITMFLVWMVKGGELNEVMKRALTVLNKDGELTSGDKGNLQLNLLSKPYSMGTARSQANQMFMAFPELGLTMKEKGKMVPNPDSALLALAYNMLGLA